MSAAGILVHPERHRLVLTQIVEMYRGGFVTLSEARRLAEKHVPDVAQRMPWLAVNSHVREDDDELQ